MCIVCSDTLNLTKRIRKVQSSISPSRLSSFASCWFESLAKHGWTIMHFVKYEQQSLDQHWPAQMRHRDNEASCVNVTYIWVVGVIAIVYREGIPVELKVKVDYERHLRAVNMFAHIITTNSQWVVIAPLVEASDKVNTWLCVSSFINICRRFIHRRLHLIGWE